MVPAKQKVFFGIRILLFSSRSAATLPAGSWLSLVPMLIILVWFSKRKMVIIIPVLLLARLLSAFLSPQR
jgi:hypothetical protein